MKKTKYLKKYGIFLYIRDKQTGKVFLQGYYQDGHFTNRLIKIYHKAGIYNFDYILQKVKELAKKDKILNMYYDVLEDPFWVRITGSKIKLKRGTLKIFWGKRNKCPGNKILFEFEGDENEEETKED